MAQEKKTYGLFLKKKDKITKNVSIYVGNIFGIDDDEENTPSFDPRKLDTTSKSSLTQKICDAEVDRALDQDATVFQYDELYDEMEERKRLSDPRRNESDKKPKYVGDLLQTAAFRKRERARRMDRKIQKEREDEADQFEDTDVFVTDNYRKKLEEREEEGRLLEFKDKMDQIGSASMQGNLSIFYRQSLHNQQSRSVPSEESAPLTIPVPLAAVTEEIPKSLVEEDKLDVKHPDKKCPQPIEETKVTPIVEVKKYVPKTEQERFKIYEKHNTAQTIAAARSRYLDRLNSNFLAKFVIT